MSNMSCILLSYNNNLSSFAVCDGEACHFQFYNYCYSTMSTPGRHPILANLKPSPLNVQSAKASTSKTPKQHVSTPCTSKGSTPKDGTCKCSLAPNRHDTGLSGRARKKIREEQDSAYLDHPYTIKLRTRKAKLLQMLHKIFELANNDIIVCDQETGLNDYS